MREIKFRGLNRSSNKWKYGYLVVDKKYTQIWQEGDVPVPVDPETVGEYIGKKDVHDKETYEDDLVRYTIPEDVPEDEREIRKIIWVDGFCGFQARTLDNRFDCFFDTEHFEIIGNIPQNPELLQKK